ncbi:MAG: hypothetical protein ACI8QZ_000004 [Chlamydiales bacterium]|jgi:hypothetical protein
METNNSTDGGRSWTAIKAAAARPTVWISTWAALFAMGLALALPWQAWFADSTSHRYAIDELIASLTATFRVDTAAATAQLDSQTAQSGAVMALAAVMLGIFSAGGWLVIFLDGRDGPRLRRFLGGGARHFARFFRLWLLLMLLLGGWYWLFYEDPWDTFVLTRWLRVPEYDQGDLYTMDSELHVVALGWARDLLFGLGFAFFMACGTYARTRMAYLSRYSAFTALLGALGMILRHPIRTLRPLIALFVFEALFVTLALGWSVRAIGWQLGHGNSVFLVLALFLLGQLAVLLRELGRGAKYHAALHVVHAIRPRSDDPELTSIGGPGGPQYPIDENSEAATDGFGATI